MNSCCLTVHADMDGFEVAKYVKNSPSLTGVTIMMITSDNRRGHSEKSQDMGISAYMVKPVKRLELLETISIAMGKDTCNDKSLSFENESPSYKDESVAPELLYPMWILLVDDYKHNRFIVQKYLRHTPVQIDIAENGAMAVEAFKSGDYDLVLMDMQMPVMDGYTATREIRKFEKEQGMKKTPVIALSAYALKEEIQKSLDAGCNEHLTKPLKKTKLLKTLFRYVATMKEDTDVHHEEENLEINHESEIVVYVDKDFEDLIPEFFEDIRHDIQSMTDALNNGDYESIRQLSHRIKGAGGAYGFDAVTNMAKFLEDAAKDGNPDSVRKYITELSNYLNRVQVKYQ